MDIYSRQLVGFAVHAGAPASEDVCRMFSSIKHGHALPSFLSTDNDPLFQAMQWKSMLRILEVEEIKKVSECPRSHPFIERLIGTVRREYLDEQVFWNERDLLVKLNEFKEYYNSSRVHYFLNGLSPLEKCQKAVVSRTDLNNYGWKSHCGGSFQSLLLLKYEFAGTGASPGSSQCNDASPASHTSKGGSDQGQ